MSFTVGQKVKLRGRDEVKGRVLKVTTKWIHVEYSKEMGWIPSKDWHEAHELVADDDALPTQQLEFNLETTPPPAKVCECGAEFTEFPSSHFSYCPMGETDKDTKNGYAR